MGKVSSLTLTDSGNYYSTIPTVTLSPPSYDSGNFAAIDSSFSKFGSGSLVHDSADVSTLGTITDSVGSKTRHFVMQSFWFYLDSLTPCTLTWNEKFRIYVNNNNNLAITYVVDSSQRDGFQTDNVQVRSFGSAAVQANKWHFAKIETNQANLRIGLDSAFIGTYVMGVATGDNYFYDSGDIIRAGYDSGYTGPNHKENIGGQYVYDSDINKSFNGHLDGFQFTVDSDKIIFDNIYSNWVPESAGDTYEDETPMFQQQFDYRRATAGATIDSATGKVATLFIIDSGDGYDSAPTLTISGGRSAAFNDQYAIGDNVTQTLSSGVKISGEVQRVQMDSAGDSNRHIFLAHVGADDGEFREFVTDRTIDRSSNTTGLTVTAVSEDNKISETEQNDEFTTTTVDDFLDFSEDNPFGDPEAQ